MFFSVLTLLTVGMSLGIVTGQDTESTTETVTYPFPDVPGAPAGMPLPTEVDAFSDVPLDTPLESLPNEVVNDIVSDIDPLPNNPINENAEEKEATDTAIIVTTTTSLITSSGTPETTVPTVQANITTVAANFDPSFLADNSNKNDLMLISEPSDTQPMSDKSFTDVDGKNRTTSDMTLEETYEGNFTEIEIFPVNQTKNYTTFPAETVIDGQNSFVASLNETLDYNITESTMPSPTVTKTTPVYVGTDPSSADSTIAGETTTIGTPTNTVYETTTIVPQIDIQSTTPVQSEDAATQSVTVVNEANIEDYLITRPRIGTSVDTITVDVGNINKYVTTRQKQPTKPSFIDTADSMPDLVGPPPPPPYDILNADANQGQGAGDQFNNMINSRNTFNTDFQPRAQPFLANSGLSKELALIMAYRNADRNRNRIVDPNLGIRGTSFPQRFNPDLLSRNNNNNLITMGGSSNLGPTFKDESSNDMGSLDTVTDNFREEVRPTPIDLPFDPDFDLVRALPLPPDPDSLSLPGTTTETTPAITTTTEANRVDIPPPPLSFDGVPPPPPSGVDGTKEKSFPPVLVNEIIKQTTLPPPILPKSSKDIYSESNDFIKIGEELQSDVIKDSRSKPKRTDVYSSDVKSLFEKDTKFVANFNPISLGFQPDYLQFGAPMAGLPWMSANQVEKVQVNTRKNQVNAEINNIENINKNVEYSKPPPIILDSNRESKPTKATNTRNILQDPLRNELLTQELNLNIPRTRVYFGSNDIDSKKGDSLKSQEFDQKLALWGNMVRQQLTQLQAGRRESVREIDSSNTGFTFRDENQPKRPPPSIGGQNKEQNRIFRNRNDIIKSSSIQKENPSRIRNPDAQKEFSLFNNNAQSVERSRNLPPPIFPMNDRPPPPINDQPPPINDRPPPPINIQSNNKFSPLNPVNENRMSVRDILAGLQTSGETALNNNPQPSKEAVSGPRIFNYWQDSNSGRQSNQGTFSASSGRAVQGINSNSRIRSSKSISPNFESQLSQKPISNTGRQPQSREPSLKSPPPINIDLNEQSTSPQQRISREIQTGRNDPTFINSAVARRNTIRTASIKNPNLSSKSSQISHTGSTINLFQLPKNAGDLYNVPDMQIGPMYQNLPENQNNIDSQIFLPRDNKAGPVPNPSKSANVERRTEVTPIPRPTAATHNGLEIITLETVPPMMEIPTTTIINIGFSEFTDPPGPVEVPFVLGENPRDTMTVSTNKNLPSQKIKSTTHNSGSENVPYNTIAASLPDLLSNGYTPTPILIVDNYQTSQSSVSNPVTTQPLYQAEISTERTTVTNIPTEMQTTGSQSLRRNPQFDPLPNVNIADTSNLRAEIKSNTSQTSKPSWLRQTSDSPPPIYVDPVTTTTTTKAPSTTTMYIPTPQPTTPVPITAPSTPPQQTPFRQLTKEEIIKRLQKDSVLKKELPPEVCHQCHYVNDVCFMSEASICNRFVECIKIGGSVRAFEKECSLGNFWNPKTLACDKSYDVNCHADPCKDSRLKRHPYNGRCRAYWICTNSTSSLNCCPKSYRYSGIDKICIPDSTCDEPCESPTDIVKEPPKSCPLKAVSGNLFDFTDGYTTQSCAPGTRFDAVQCTCVKSNLLPEGEVCKPDTVVDFEGGRRRAFKDKSGRMNGIGEKFVILRQGTGLFYGSGKLSFWRYANVELGPRIAIKIRFKPYGRSKRSMGLLSNCNGTPIGSTIDIRLNTWTNEITFKLSTNQKLDNKITLKYKPFEWNEAIFIYDGSSFSVASNEQAGQIFVEGSIPQRHPEIQVGGCGTIDGYLGYIDDVYVYNGCIPEEVDWVLFAR